MHYLLQKTFWLFAFLALVLTPLIVLLVGRTPGGSGFWVDLAIALGYAGLAIMGVQFILTARFRKATLPFGIDIIYYFHRFVAFVALALIVAHVVILVLDNPAWLANFNPLTASRDVAVGIVSLLLLALLIGTSVWRKQLKIRYDRWRIGHGILATAAVLLAVAHIELIGYYIQIPWKRALWTVITLSWIFLILYIRLLKPWFMLRKPYKVIGIAPEHGNAWTLTLAAQGHKGIRFMAGQFVWLTLRHSPFAAQEHPFSIASSAERPERLEFTIKELGDFTRTIKEIQPDETAYLDGPYGAFSIDRHPDAPGYVFIGGGIGSAPLMSMLRTLADRQDQRPLLFFYGNNTWEEVTFREELEQMKTRLPNLAVVHLLADPPQDWTGEVGFLNLVKLERHLPVQFQRFEHYICGPEPMIVAAERALHYLNVPPQQVHSEIFNLV